MRSIVVGKNVMLLLAIPCSQVEHRVVRQLGFPSAGSDPPQPYPQRKAAS